MGLITQAFNEEDLVVLPGHLGIGHARYSTTGRSTIENSQPIFSNRLRRGDRLAHNGNIVNARALRSELEDWGATFKTTSDSEIIAHLMTHARLPRWRNASLRHGQARRSVFPDGDDGKIRCTAFGDPMGVRPLCIGKLNGGWVIASETCALDQIDAEFIRDIHPGEVVAIDADGLRSVSAGCPTHSGSLHLPSISTWPAPTADR